MKGKLLCAVTALACAAGMLTAVPASAKTADLDFENVSVLSDIKGSGKFFTSGSNVTEDTAILETETMGTYTNKYLSVKYNNGANNILVSDSILDNDITVVSARLKFYSGSQAGLIIRTSSNQYLAVNNGGSTALRLLNNSSYTITGYDGKWVDVRYVITKTSSTTADIVGYMMLTGQPDTMITCSLNNFAINSGTHLRFQADGGEKGSIDNLVVKSYSSAEAVTLVKEDFEQFAEGAQNGNASRLSGNSLLRPTANNAVSVAASGNNKYLALANNAATLYDFKVPTKTKSVLSFDMKASSAAVGNKTFVRPTGGGEYNLVRFDSNGQAVVMDYAINGLASRLTSEFVHFDFVIDAKGTATTINGYVDGQLINSRGFDVVFGDFRAQAAADSEVDLDNITISTPGAASMTAAAGAATKNSATITIDSSNIIDPDTITASIGGEAQTITKTMSNSGKTYTLTLSGLEPGTAYSVDVAASDYFGQAMAARTVEFTTEALTQSTAVVTDKASVQKSDTDKATGVAVEVTPNDYAVCGIQWTFGNNTPFNTSFGDTVVSGSGPVTAALYIDGLFIDDIANYPISVEALNTAPASSVATME